MLINIFSKCWQVVVVTRLGDLRVMTSKPVEVGRCLLCPLDGLKQQF